MSRPAYAKHRECPSPRLRGAPSVSRIPSLVGCTRPRAEMVLIMHVSVRAHVQKCTDYLPFSAIGTATVGNTFDAAAATTLTTCGSFFSEPERPKNKPHTWELRRHGATPCSSIHLGIFRSLSETCRIAVAQHPAEQLFKSSRPLHACARSTASLFATADRRLLDGQPAEQGLDDPRETDGSAASPEHSRVCNETNLVRPDRYTNFELECDTHMSRPHSAHYHALRLRPDLSRQVSVGTRSGRCPMARAEDGCKRLNSSGERGRQNQADQQSRVQGLRDWSVGRRRLSVGCAVRKVTRQLAVCFSRAIMIARLDPDSNPGTPNS